LDAAAKNGIYVIMGYEVNHSSVGITADGAAMVSDFVSMVHTWKNHPAVLMWMFGNEVADPTGDNSSFKSMWYPLLNTACQNAHAEDGAHPVGTASKDIFDIGNASFFANDASLPALDIWGINVYRGLSFGNTFSVMGGTSTSKAYFFSEWGCDAYNGVKGAEDELMQSTYIQSQWSEISAALATKGTSCVGGTVFEWNDEWWKGDSIAGQMYTIGMGGVHGPSVQDTSSDWTNPLYVEDPNMNEEWWGLVGIAPNSTTRRLRLAYYALQTAWLVPVPGQTINGVTNPAVIFQDEIHSFPNPFRAVSDFTTIKIVVSGAPDLTVEIFDLLGHKVCGLPNIIASGSERLIEWRGTDSNNQALTAGLYICKVTANIVGREEVKFRKIVIAK
ncbi:MAG: T9SS type A sorting domain-containing protein, partial [Endomicrobiales bacterium]